MATPHVKPDRLGTPVNSAPGTWVQTERKAHEAWARLGVRKPRASALLHHLVARMGQHNVVAASQEVLAKIVGVNKRTVQRAVADLVAERWIQVVKLSGPGSVSAYVVNDQVAFGEKRENMRFSIFSATIIADADDQDARMLEPLDLRRIPVIYPGERQLPSGDGEPPPSAQQLPGLEPELPAIKRDPHTVDMLRGTADSEKQHHARGVTHD